MAVTKPSSCTFVLERNIEIDSQGSDFMPLGQRTACRKHTEASDKGPSVAAVGLQTLCALSLVDLNTFYILSKKKKTKFTISCNGTSVRSVLPKWRETQQMKVANLVYICQRHRQTSSFESSKLCKKRSNSKYSQQRNSFFGQQVVSIWAKSFFLKALQGGLLLEQRLNGLNCWNAALRFHICFSPHYFSLFAQIPLWRNDQTVCCCDAFCLLWICKTTQVKASRKA